MPNELSHDRRPITVLKFGSSILAGSDGFRIAAREIERHVQDGARVLGVVSAMSGTTDRLLNTANGLRGKPQDSLVTRLLATGEEASVLLLGMALAEVGVSASLFDATALGLRTSGPLLDADPLWIDTEPLRAAWETTSACIVPGFIGSDRTGRTSVLGRGGSDLTALFLADRLGGECRLVKDVDGLYAEDPATSPDARPFERASWNDVLRLGKQLVQSKAAEFARGRALECVISSPGGRGTRILGGAP